VGASLAGSNDLPMKYGREGNEEQAYKIPFNHAHPRKGFPPKKGEAG
jgi:hypothetical protein